MRQLLFLALVIALGYLISSLAFPKRCVPRQSGGRTPTTVTQEMVRDPICHLYLPRTEAIRRNVRGQEHFFCSLGCLTNFSLSARDAPTMPLADLSLVGLRVFEFAQGIAGPVCGKLLAEFGAQHIKVEPLSGEITRHQTPSADNHPDLEVSLLYLDLNTTKRSITLSLASRAGRRLFEALMQHAEVIIDDHTSPASAAVSPECRLIYTSIRPFGMNGPPADLPFAEQTAEALGGVMGVVGDPERPPFKLGGEQASYRTGLNAAVATLLALESLELTGRGRL